MNLTDPIFTDEAKARAYMESIRWPNGPFCPHCGSVDKVYRLNGKKHRPGLIHCNACDGAFTVTTRTVMESSHVPLNKWVLAFRLMSSSKKGISAHQLHRTIGVTYKTAWFMCHRIREAMRDDSGQPLGGLGKTVEADEVFVGGKPRKSIATGDGRSSAADRKTPVAVLVERDGRVIATPVPNVTKRTLQHNIAENVLQGTAIYTDEAPSYGGLEKVSGGTHLTVNHGANEFARESVHANTAESWNALLKRGVYGTFHHISREHMGRYCDEFSFRWNYRKVADTERAAAAVKGADRKRVLYKSLIDHK